MFIPSGGLVQLFLTGFKMVQFVVQEGSRIAALASSIIGGVANIAKGNITGAVQKVESSLAQLISCIYAESRQERILMHARDT
jgi:hypothetical protein